MYPLPLPSVAWLTTPPPRQPDLGLRDVIVLLPGHASPQPVHQGLEAVTHRDGLVLATAAWVVERGARLRAVLQSRHHGGQGRPSDSLGPDVRARAAHALPRPCSGETARRPPASSHACMHACGRPHVDQQDSDQAWHEPAPAHGPSRAPPAPHVVHDESQRPGIQHLLEGDPLPHHLLVCRVQALHPALWG